MRRTLACVALAVTSMVALSFLIPLALLVRSEARARAITVAEQQAAALAPVLTISTNPADVRQAVAGMDAADRISIHLPDGSLIGEAHAPKPELREVERKRQTTTMEAYGGWVYLQPVVLGRGRVAVVEAFVPQADLTRGVAASWGVMAVLALGLVAGSVVVADRLASRVVRSSRELSRASLALGGGDLDVRVLPAGPAELHEAGLAFNSMADRVVELLALERELVADLSHRLRTPLTALRLEAERLEGTTGSERLTAAIAQLESEVDSIITAARTPLANRAADRGTALTGAGAGLGRPVPVPGTGGSAAPAERCEAARVVWERAEFWSVLAAQQGRPMELDITSEPTPVGLSRDDLAAVVDALLGNVFRHTPDGTAFAVRVARTAQAVVVAVDDAGPGIDHPESALARGVSEGGSTGLGLDIAHRAARATRGEVRIRRGVLGGALVEVVLGLAGDAVVRGPSGRRRGSRLRRGRRPERT